jgi:hypothetical protein
MNLPEQTILDLLEANYDLTTETITTADITWTLQDWSEELGKYKPYVSVKMLGGTRDQPVDTLFKFNFTIQVIWWPQHEKDAPAFKALVWTIAEKLRDIVEDATLLPSGWKSMIVLRVTDASVLAALPNVTIKQLTVQAEIDWA